MQRQCQCITGRALRAYLIQQRARALVGLVGPTSYPLDTASGASTHLRAGARRSWGLPAALCRLPIMMRGWAASQALCH
jgi:hypothetical protein